ncbi:MAG: hypothetical protein ACI4VM_05845 [Anaerovoracaceae bacterium]
MLKRFSAVCMALAMTFSLAAPAWAASVKRPVLTSVSVSDGVLDEEDMEYDYTVTVNAKGSDAEIAHISLQFENKSNDNTANMVLRASDKTEEGIYTGTLSINAYLQEGTFRLIKVTLRDEKGNCRYYCQKEDLPKSPGDDKKALPQTVSLRLDSGVKTDDQQAPVLDSCRMSDTLVLKETTAALHARVTETGSGIDYVKARFTGDNGRSISLTLTRVDQEYVGFLSPSQLKHEGVYTLQRIMLKDNAGNRRVVSDLDEIQFEVVS